MRWVTTASSDRGQGQSVDGFVTSDEGYDERAVDCGGVGDSMSSLGSSSEYRGSSGSAFKRSATFCQSGGNGTMNSSRTYSSFNSHVSTLDRIAAANAQEHQSCKLNRSESDSAAQHSRLLRIITATCPRHHLRSSMMT